MDTLSDLSTLVSAAGKVAGAGVAIYDRYQQINTNSLTRATNKSTIRSRAYIDEQISTVDVVPNILRVSAALYSGMILSALKLNAFVSQGRTVNDHLAVIRTSGMEDFNDAHTSLEDLASSLSKEDLFNKPNGYRNPITNRPGTAPSGQASSPGTSSGTGSSDLFNAQGKTPKDAIDRVKDSVTTKNGTYVAGSATDATQAAPEIFPIGKTIDVTFQNPDGKAAPITIPLTVQILPYIVNERSIPALLSVSSRSSLKQRWMQFKSGEISFWRDFVFQIDRLKKMEAAMRADKSGHLTQYLDDMSKKDKFRLTEILFNSRNLQNAQLSNNVANTILILSEDAVRRAKVEDNLDIHNNSSRARFFNATYAMMIFVVDESHNLVTLYMNGVDGVGHYSFGDFSSAKKSDNTDLLKVMAALMDGRAPRL